LLAIAASLKPRQWSIENELVAARTIRASAHRHDRKCTRGTLNHEGTMSRGLGKLQRFIKAQIYRAEHEYKRESAILFARMKLDPKFDPDENSVKCFFAYWWDVRHWVEENEEFNPGPYRMSESLERSTKRALHTLVKRGEIANFPFGRLNQYMTREMAENLRGTGKAIAEGFARMEAEGSDRHDRA